MQAKFASLQITTNCIDFFRAPKKLAPLEIATNCIGFFRESRCLHARCKRRIDYMQANFAPLQTTAICIDFFGARKNVTP